MIAAARTCVITGASGYVGGQIARWLEARGWSVVELGRRATQPSRRHIAWTLGDTVPPLPPADALIHCAWDFSQHRWPDIERVNVQGSRALLVRAHVDGIKRIVFVSSISAFDGCRSMYGKAKLAVEAAARDAGAVMVRPGLVYGPDPGGMFGALANTIAGSRFVPLLDGGRHPQYLVHRDDLCAAMERFADPATPAPPAPMTLANARPVPLREIVAGLAAAAGKRVSTIAVPWRAAYAACLLAERAGLRLPFRSDSIISYVFQDPAPNFDSARSLGLNLRPWRAQP